MDLEELRKIFKEKLREYKNTAILLLYGGASEVIPVGSTLFFKTIEFRGLEKNNLDIDSIFCVYSNDKKDIDLRIPISQMKAIERVKQKNDALFGNNPEKIAELVAFSEELLKIDEHATEMESAKKMHRIGMFEIGATAVSKDDEQEFNLGLNYSIFPVDISKLKEKERTLNKVTKKAGRDAREDGINRLTKKAFERELRKNTYQNDDELSR